MIDAEGIRARLIAGQAFGMTSPLVTASDTLHADVQLAPGARLPIEPGYEDRARHTIAGTIEVAGDSFEPGQLLVLSPSDPMTVRATTDARFMLFGGDPIEGPRYVWWSLVSSPPERIVAAKEEWARGPIRHRAGR
jgi:redox-sensitive bicupin YhaK (pirin superfamily)